MQQNMSGINEDYSSLGELLKNRGSELSALLLKVQGVQHEAQTTLQWLDNMKKTAESWNSERAGDGSMKMQMERQKVSALVFNKLCVAVCMNIHISMTIKYFLCLLYIDSDITFLFT